MKFSFSPNFVSHFADFSMSLENIACFVLAWRLLRTKMYKTLTVFKYAESIKRYSAEYIIKSI